MRLQRKQDLHRPGAEGHCWRARLLKDTQFSVGVTIDRTPALIWLRPDQTQDCACRYQGYDLAESILDFSITINMTISSAAETSESSNSGIVLAPDRPAAASVDGKLRANLVGDLQAYQALPVFSSKVLLIPAPSDMGLDQILKASPEKWMIVDRSQVSTDGTQCNKIGTAFTAFRYDSRRTHHPRTCIVPVPEHPA